MLQPTDHYGRVTFLGVVAADEATIRSAARDALTLTLDGAEGERHSGRTRPSCVRVKRQYAQGTEIANARQLSILSAEELAEIAAAMEIDRIAPEWTGASIVLEGIPQFTLIPPSSHLIFESGASVVNDMENSPCMYPGREIERHHPGKGRLFPEKARNKRGICGWVERPGEIRLGMAARLHIPPQRIWAP